MQFSARILPILLALFLASGLRAAEPPGTSSGRRSETKDEREPAPEIVSISEALKDTIAFPGLISIYRDSVSGALLIRLRPENFGREYIHCTFVQDGPPIAGFFRGDFRDNHIVTLRRDFDRVSIIAKNTAFYFDPASPLARASSANRLDSVLATVPIVGEDKVTGEVVIEAGNFFLEETLTQVAPTPPTDEEAAKNTFTLGELDSDRTAIVSVKNYPENTDIVVDYVFANPQPVVRGGPDVTDPRFITVRIQHSMIAAPASEYRPRYDDPRVGYFTVEQTDLTTTRPAPYHDMITRWHLRKKQPAAALSEPVEPVVFWIENTTPRELRPYVRSGTLAWNAAFEAAGFRDAIVVKEQPDDASWDAGDIRYNVLRWASSPAPSFGGLGPSFVDPRTGQILGADVMFEYVYLTNRMMEDSLFAGATAHRPPSGHACSLAAQRQASLLLGRAVAAVNSPGEAAQHELIRQAITELVAHEVGHVLGLMHNKRGSQLHAPAVINDAALTAAIGLSGSVMDYNQINLAPPGVKQGQYFPDRVGPYDVWAIQFGYTESLPGAAAESARISALLARSTEPSLAFGNDSDECTEPGTGVDPRVLSFDIGSDPIGGCAGRFDLLRRTLAAPAILAVAPDSSYENVVLKYRVVMRDALDLSRALAAQIGGVWVDRAFAGQNGATRPFTPVPAGEQRKAIAALRREVFAPAAFAAPVDLIAHLQRQRRGFHFEDIQDEPAIHRDVLGIQTVVLDHVLHPRVLDRITDSALYGGDYSVAALGNDLTAAIFDDDANTSVNTRRQNLQTVYVERLVHMLTPQEQSLSPVNRAMALAQLENLRSQLKTRSAVDSSTDAHVAHLLFIITRALDTRAAAVN